MNKLISFLVIVFITIISITSTNAFWTYANKTHLSINWNHIITWKQVYIDWQIDDTLYFSVRNVLSAWKDEYKYYNYTNWELLEVEEFVWNKMNYDNAENWTISQHYKQVNNYENFTTSLNIDWKEYWPYNTDYINIVDLSNKAFWYKYSEWTDDYVKLFFYPENEVKSNPKIDKLLNKIFIKIDKKWESKVKLVYQWLIKKIDTLISKSKTEKNKELLEYIKYKVEEKIK